MTTPGYIYLIGSENFGWYKIGRSRVPTIRIEDLGILLPFKIEVFAVWQTSNSELVESIFHKLYSESNINGEWFSFNLSQLKNIVTAPGPFDSYRVFPGEKDNIFCKFSNIEEDITIDKWKEQKILKSKLFMQAVEDYIVTNSLDKTKDNIKKAKRFVAQKLKEPISLVPNGI